MKKTMIPWQGRDVRAFHREDVGELDLRAWLDVEYWDDEDKARYEVLKMVLEDSPVIVEVDDSDVDDGHLRQRDSVDVYLRIPRKQQRVLAFTLLSETAIEEDRFHGETIVETFSTIVSDVGALTDDAILAALFKWSGRDFKDVQLPPFKIHRGEMERAEVKVEIALKKARLAAKYEWNARLDELTDLPEEVEGNAMPEFEQAA